MEQVWLNSYPVDIPTQIDLQRTQSLVALFEESVAKFADSPAFSSMGNSLTYQRLDELSRAFAAYLQQELKLEQGDRIALMSPNVLQYPVALFGALRAGLVVVNVNPLYSARELKHQLVDSGAKAIVIVSNFAYTLEQIVDQTPIEHVILTNMGDQLSLAKRTLVNFVVKYIKKLVPKYHLPHARSMRSALAKGRHLQYVRPDLQPEDLAFLQYTGGTTGVAKGAMLSHGNMVANVEQIYTAFRPRLQEGQEVVITALPLYHIFALTVNCLLFMKLGSKNVLIANPRDIPTFIKSLKAQPFTAITGVNTLFNVLLNDEDFHQVDFSNLKLSLGGGMAVQKTVADRWQQVTGKALLEGYGLTECAPVASAAPYNSQGYDGTIGLPLPSTLMRVVDEQGQPLPCGERGELQVYGPQVMQGYWQRPEATAEAIVDGWLFTGDVAVCDERGYFSIVDRKKDMILVSGFNVYPNEIEDVVAMHEGVMEVAAIGVPNEATGEAVKIFVVARNADLTEQDIMAHCRQYLTAYKVPKQIEFRPELPKTNVGKILRRELKQTEAA